MMDWREQLTGWAEASLRHPAWGVSHCRRVYRLSLSLMEAEGIQADDDVAFAVAYLHDAGAFKPWGTGGAEQQKGSARAAEEILPNGFPQQRRDLVIEIIREHGFDKDPGSRPEAQAFHDADVLDFLGAVGIMRLLAIVGIEDWTPDVRSALDVAESFARDLPAKLILEPARELAERRSAEMTDYLARLRDETADYRDL